MKIRYLVASSLFALVAGGGAQAADLVDTRGGTMSAQINAVPVFSWQGVYVGGQIGGSWARGNLRTAPYDSTGARWAARPDGFIGGVYAGYNVDTGNSVILGFDTDFLWSDVDGSDKQGNLSVRIKQKWAGSTRVRVGYAADRWLPYIAGGVSYARINTTMSASDADGNKISSGSYAKTRAGWNLGTGVDYAVTDNVLLRLEYRYTDLGKKTTDLADLGGERTSYRANDFRVGVAYKF